MTLSVLVASSTLAAAVKVASQVLPPSLLDKGLRLPLSTLTSALLKSLTASLKLIVTVALWPAVKLLTGVPLASLRVRVALGSWVSIW